MILTTLNLNPRHPDVINEKRDLCQAHSRIIDATVGMPTDGPRVLWARPKPNLLIIRAPEPVTAARLPAGYAHTIHHRPWLIPDRPGRWVMNAVLNPARSDRSGGPTLNQPDRPWINLPPVIYTDPDQQIQWLGRRLEKAATLVEARPVKTRIVRGEHRTGRVITIRWVQMHAVWDVHDPQAMVDRLNAGVGHAKTWGCGLTVWAPAGACP